MEDPKTMSSYVKIPLRGKRPLPDNWTDPVSKPIEAMSGYGEKWSERDITGYGILLGTPAGHGYVVVAVDIDLEDEDGILSIRSTLPYGNMMKRGKKGVTMFYRTTPELAKSRVYKGMVDYLGIGRQTVMPPSIHPETNKPYEWYEGTGWTLPHDLLILTEEHIEAMEEQLVKMGWCRRYTVNTARHQIRAVAADGDRVEGSIQWLNRQALDNIPSWVEQLGLYNGVWSGARYACVNTLRSSSTGQRPEMRKRNLSISPNGIRDFGSNETYSPIDLVAAMMGMDIDNAYKWLAERCDPLWGERQDISALLAKAPKVKTPRREPQENEEDEGARLEVTKVNRNMGPLPLKAYENAPGFIGRYAREVVRQSPRIPKTLATLAGISAISAITARRYVGETRRATLQLTTYVCAMASTGAGKDAALKFHGRFAKACAARGDARTQFYDYGAPEERLSKKVGGVVMAPAEGLTVNAFDRLIVAADMTGDAGFTSLLWTSSPCPWLVIDELGAVFLSLSSNKQKSSVSVTALLRSWYSLTPVAIGKSYAYNQTVSKELLKLRQTPLRYPAPSLFGVTTPEQMYSALDKSMAEDGTINRFIIAHEDPEPDTPDDVYDSLFGGSGSNEITPDLIEEAVDIFAYRVNHGVAEPCEGQGGAYAFLGYQNETDDRFDIFAEPSLIVVEAANDEVRRAMRDYVMNVKEETSVPGLEAYTVNAVARVGENFLRLCYLAAIADNEGRGSGAVPTVQLSHAEWAKSVMEAVKHNLTSLVGDHIGSRADKDENKLIDRLQEKAEKLVTMWQADEALPAKAKVFDRGWITVNGLLQQLKSTERKQAAALLKGTMKDQNIVEHALIDPAVGTPTQRGKPCVRFMSMFE